MMNYNTVYVGMDVHKESFTLCCFQIGKETASHIQKISSDYKLILKYLDRMRSFYGETAKFICGYEAGCLGYTLYHQLTACNIECIILAPTTILKESGKRKTKTDKKDAELIAKALAYRTYSPVHIPTEKDEEVKEFLRMRNDHKIALKKVKQQILSFCLRHNYVYSATKGNWTQAHIQWLRNLQPGGIYQEILDEYIATFDLLTHKLQRLDERIEELASEKEYQNKVNRLVCFKGIRTHTALSVIVETGDFNRFETAEKYASYLGLVPGEHSSGENQTHLSITKAGNKHIRTLLVEAAQCYNRGQTVKKSKNLTARQCGNPAGIIAYADKANERLRRRYIRMTLHKGKKSNIAKTAIARELACFIWGMMTDNVA